MEDLTLISFLGNYGLFIWAGIFGSVSYCVSHDGMGFRKTIGHIIRSIFIGVLVGMAVRELTSISNDLVFVVSAGSCYFSNAIIFEIKEILSKISDYVDDKVKEK